MSLVLSGDGSITGLTSSGVASSSVGYTPAGTGAVATTVQTKLRETVSVKDFGAVGDGVADDTAAFTAAISKGKVVYAPTGTYRVNVIVTQPFILIGDGSQFTIIKPHNVAQAAITYNATSPYWTYHSEIRNVGFTTSSTAKTGVGFTFGTTIPANYTSNMEFASNVKFYGCQFLNLFKGVQFPFGNIGTEFYSCGFNGNYYGAYMLDAKFGGVMHAGNKYFFGGEFGENICGIYLNNVTEGFGAVEFFGTIFQYNNIAGYIYTNNAFVPITFHDCWNEGNGSLKSASNQTIDSWSGTTVTNQSVAPYAFIFAGANTTYKWNGGFLTGINLSASNSRVLSKDSRVEVISNFLGQSFNVLDAESSILVINPETNGGIFAGTSVPSARVFVSGNFKPRVYSITSGGNQSRVVIAPHRYTKLSGSYGGSGTVVNLTSASNLGNGSFSVTAGTTSDGIIYGTCNTYSIPFTATNEYTALIAGTVSLLSGAWYVVTFDAKVTSGSPTFNSWDRNTNQLFATVQAPELNVWHTFAAMGYSPNAVATFYALDIGTAAATTATVLLSAFQIRQFATEQEAQAFLESNVYVGP